LRISKEIKDHEEVYKACRRDRAGPELKFWVDAAHLEKKHGHPNDQKKRYISIHPSCCPQTLIRTNTARFFTPTSDPSEMYRFKFISTGHGRMDSGFMAGNACPEEAVLKSDFILDFLNMALLNCR